MPTQIAEALVILSPSAPADVAATVQAQARLTQRLPERLLVVEAGPLGVQRLRELPGVAAVLTSGADKMPDGLEPGEVLFVEAWATRQRAGKRDRLGEGLDWDAPGFQPPDPPARPRPR